MNIQTVRLMPLLLFLALSPFAACSCQQITTAERSADRGHQDPPLDLKDLGGLDPQLWAMLQRKNELVRPFAWEGKPEHGVIEVIDSSNVLRFFHFKKVNGGYEIEEPDREEKIALIDHAGSIALIEVLPEAEFPFRVNTLDTDNCRVHFVQVQVATGRAFTNSYTSTSLKTRILVERDSQLISNHLDEATPFSERIVMHDVNGDRRREVIICREYRFMDVAIYTVEPDCTVRKIQFLEESIDGPFLDDSVGGGVVSLEPDGVNGVYKVILKNWQFSPKAGAPDWVEEATIYKWDQKNYYFKKVSERERRVTREQMEVPPLIPGQ